MLALRQKVSILLIFSEIFLHRIVHSEGGFDFYKGHNLVQAGEDTFACRGRPVELKWKYRYLDHIKTVWMKQRGADLVHVASWSQNTFTLDPLAADVGLDAKLSSDECCTLKLSRVEKSDEGLYAIEVTTGDSYKAIKKGNTSLYVYDDCPYIGDPQLSIACDAADRHSVKTTDFTYRDIVNLSVVIPNNPVVRRRFYYQEQQHKIVQQPIQARCYNRDDCDVVHWTLSNRALSLAFYSKTPYLSMTLFARLYHKRALLKVLNLTFRIINPESPMGKSLMMCNTLEPLSMSIRWKSSTWNVVLSTSLAFAVSNFIHQIILLS